MEKFSKWADKSGVNPFIPAIPSLPTNKVVKFLRVIFGFCLLLIRVPLIIIITAVYCILRLLTHPYFISILGASITQKEGEGNMGFGLFVFGLGLLMKKHKMFFRIILRLIDMSVLKILLLGLALNFREEPADAKRLGLKSMHKKEKFPDPIGKGLDRGDLIISNYVSFAQIIYLQSQFSPLYTAVVLPEEEGSVETSVIELGFFGALYHSVRGPIRSSSVKKTETLSAILDRNRYTAPVVVFPEAVRTNGDALLKFADIFDLGKFPMTASVFLFMFSFKGNGYSACHPVGPIWSKLFWLIFQLRNEASIYYINGYDTPPMPIPQICQNAEKEKANKKDSSPTSDNQFRQNLKKAFPDPPPENPNKDKLITKWETEVRNLMSSASGTPKVNLNYKDSISFNTYFNLLYEHKKAAAANVADSRKKNN